MKVEKKTNEISKKVKFCFFNRLKGGKNGKINLGF